MICSQTLEIHHLANRDPHLHFALLTDWPDAAKENLPEDEAVAGARKGRDRIVESQIRRRPARSFFPFPSAPPLERERRRLDGLRTEARKADAVQRLSSRALRGMFCGSRGRPDDLASKSNTSSPSIPTRSCRASQPASWSARWRIR